MNNIKKYSRTLQIHLWGWGIALGILIIFSELDLLPTGYWSLFTKSEYFSTLFMELLSLINIPLSLKIFHFSFIKKKMKSKDSLFLNFCLVRLYMLLIPMAINIFFYYAYMNPALGYLGIICSITILFIYPSTQRCENEYKSIHQIS